MAEGRDLAEALAPLSVDPIEAARAWIAHPDRDLSDELLTAAEMSIDVAQKHFHELDRLASETVIEGVERGTIDEARIMYLEAMATTFNDFSEALRDLLELDRVDAEEAVLRIHAGIAAAHRSGGLHALVVAITAT